jgi:hypothetical protein
MAMPLPIFAPVLRVEVGADVGLCACVVVAVEKVDAGLGDDVELAVEDVGVVMLK